MDEHMDILNKIELIKYFFNSIGLEKIKDIPEENWNLDSSYKFIPIKDFKIYYQGKEKVLLSVDVFIVGGLHFVLRDTTDVSVYETIKTDYNFEPIYHKILFFKELFRDWKIKQLLYENN